MIGRALTRQQIKFAEMSSCRCMKPRARLISFHTKYGKVKIAVSVIVAYVVRGPSSPQMLSSESVLVRDLVHPHVVTCICCKGT